MRKHPDRLNDPRARKPTVPLTGDHGLALRDMWEFVKPL